MPLPSLQLGSLLASVSIIQGGMGIGVSRSRLTSTVTNAGGIGVISGAQIGFDEPDFEVNHREANIRALRKEIRNALIESVEKGNIPVKRCYGCLQSCNPKTTPYCISKAIVSVKELMDRLVLQAEAALAKA